ncbi:hypothetical protein [Romboutsia lituseburensis]|uniref:Uncharacterized protein n=1 Tax=Romboutsia lituseburensis DSM 797 TaxID=1121325 RepID=A0A1G9PKE7_9FIRM|nr:hypothetical protein [Romboutsia lituseburensis]CEH33407.1 Hypothetical protein RLITU_0805 [Romboutsia lituseburensis]SDL98687.1 hypothetical protein SAMN04515677_104383 [Romboutsia lituseburensis DSM 797]
MIKNKMVKLVGSAMAAALVFGTCIPTITANANAPEQGQTNIENMDREQYEYARQEIQTALDLLDNADLTNVDNYNKMMAFTNAAKQRLEGMESNQWVDDLYSRIEKEIFPSANVALRLMNDMRALQGVDKNDKENKEAWINALNEAVTYARVNYLANDNTLRSAIKVLHTEAGLITEDKEDQKTEEVNMDREQYDYARQEIETALDLLDNADLTNVDNYNRMMAFTGAAKQRLEGMESNQWVDDLYSRIEKEIFPSANVALRLMNDMRALQRVDKNDKENKEAWIDALNEAITYARVNYLANDSTLRSAIDVLHTEAGLK